MSTELPAADAEACCRALRQLIRSGAAATPSLEQSPLLQLPVVSQRCQPDARPAQRAQIFLAVLRQVIRGRLEGKEAQIAALLFALEGYSGLPMQERYRAAAKLHNPRGSWEQYRKEPLSRHLAAVYLALTREADLPAAETAVKPQPRVLIVQNISREGPGLLAKILDEVAVNYTLINLSKGNVFPDPTTYSALVVLGGPDSANDATPKMVTEHSRVKQALDAGVPFLGICLGLQIAAKVSGGRVVKGVKEVGLRDATGTPYSVSLTDIALTALGKKDPLFLGLRNDFRVFQLHGETVTLTPSMQLLATGRDCHNQIVKFSHNAYGIQSHFELTPEMLQEWLQADPDLTPLSEQHVLAEFAELEEIYTITGLSLLRNFLHIAGVI
ncbi:MAG TPA: type 1 glutamine amidotransferase [Candidatus Saccharimonadales bacterium]|nr:type 1 glutamine amidotransferase [Candidatus Saccharimonadales bacterium]